MKLCTAIITFNTSAYLVRQFQSFDKYIGGHIIVVDNSSNPSAAKEIQELTEKHGKQYLRLHNQEGDASRSHALALNEAYWLLNLHDILILCDHDIFPINQFDVPAFMEGIKLSGVPQIRGEYTYLWAGLVIVNNKLADKQKIRFDTQLGLDTGGRLHYYLKTLKETDVKMLDEFQKRTEEGYDYSMISDKFLHLSNGSNWKKDENHEQRVNSIFNAVSFV